MPRAGKHTGPTNAGSAAANAAERAAADARQAEADRRRRAVAGAERYAMSRAEVDAHHADLDWVLRAAIGYAQAGDERMADYTLRHAIHCGVGVVELAGALADIGAMRAPANGAP